MIQCKHNMSGSEGSWRRETEGSWRRGGTRGRYGERGRPADRNSFGGGRWPNSGSEAPWRRNYEFQNANFVAELKLGAIGSYNPNLRTDFQEPSQFACYSRTSDGNIHWDDRCLRRFRPSVMSESGADLNEGFETFAEKKEGGDACKFGDFLACLRSKGTSLENVHFVTFRNNLNKILRTVYERRDGWEMGVYKRFGTIYLDIRNLPEGPLSEQRRRNCYWGYSFEHLATENRNGTASASEGQIANGAANKAALLNETVDANVEFCAVLSTKLGPHRIIMAAEMDCYESGGDGKKIYVELKTSRELEPRTAYWFEKDKLLKFWIQSFLAGVPKIVCGFWEGNGKVVRSEMMTLEDITNRVKHKHFWEGAVCLAFAEQVLSWLNGVVKENEDYLLRFVANGHRLELLRGTACPEIITKHLEELTVNV